MSEVGTEVLVERKDTVLWITINRPERRNALNAAVIDGIKKALLEAGHDKTVRAVVLTGAGEKAFCAGADLQKTDDKRPFLFDPAQSRHPFIDLLEAFGKCEAPIVARINGPVMAGGVGLLCACDMAVAVEEAVVGTPEVRIGMFPMMILNFMQRLIPRRKLVEMCLTAEPFTATEALGYGLYNYVVPAAELDTKTDWLLARLLDKSPTAQRIGKHAMQVMMDMSLDQGFAFSQIQLPLMSLTDDAKEGVAAFNEKRPPKFTGK